MRATPTVDAQHRAASANPLFRYGWIRVEAGSLPLDPRRFADPRGPLIDRADPGPPLFHDEPVCPAHYGGHLGTTEPPSPCRTERRTRGLVRRSRIYELSEMRRR